MRRWLIAVFTLHFLVSVGAFAFGHTSIHIPAHGPATHLDAQAGPVTHHSPTADLLRTLPDHGLTDAQPDLPDIIKPVVASLGTVPPHPAPTDAHWVPPPSPVLDGLQRPPRGATLFV